MENIISGLVKQYLETGNEQYFVELASRFQPLIKAYAHKLYYLEYEDSLQELTLALYEAITKMTKINDEYSCISYIKKSVIHRFCKLYYESINARKVQGSNTYRDLNQIACGGSNHDIQDCIYRTDLINSLKGKSELERSIMILILSGYSDNEIGHQLGYSRQYINRIKKRILRTSSQLMG